MPTFFFVKKGLFSPFKLLAKARLIWYNIRMIDTKELIEQLNEEIWKLIAQYDVYFEKFAQTPDGEELVERIYEVLQVSDEEVFKVVLPQQDGDHEHGRGTLGHR